MSPALWPTKKEYGTIHKALFVTAAIQITTPIRTGYRVLASADTAIIPVIEREGFNYEKNKNILFILLANPCRCSRLPGMQPA
jgi:hypothetical protein